MKKFILVVIMLLGMVSISEAKIYVALDKQTGEAKGTVDIDEKTIGDWSKDFIMIEADESYRGMQGYEVKYDNKKLKKATDKEVGDYKKEVDDKIKNARERKALEDLGLTKNDLVKIKAIQ